MTTIGDYEEALRRAYREDPRAWRRKFEKRIEKKNGEIKIKKIRVEPDFLSIATKMVIHLNEMETKN